VRRSAIDRAVNAHRSRWGEPSLVVRAPGRVNLIGEHTDYNDGFTMPMALPMDTAVAIGSDGDPVSGAVTVSSHGFGEISFRPGGRIDQVPQWAHHLYGVVELLGEQGIASGGWRATIDTDIPTGASLSSSAALEVATITALLARAGITWRPIEVARLGQRVENEVIGLPSGIMDQFISAGAVDGHVSLMDCRALTLSPVPLMPGVTVAVMDTGTRRVLAEAAYGDRRASCERAALAIGVAALRDASVADLAAVPDTTDRRRARHIVTENERTKAAAQALIGGDAALLGDLMDASHTSLRDDFEVSAPALDAIVTIACEAPGALGARMTGGGFAGCAVALVESSAIAEFSHHVTDRYRFEGHTARLYPVTPGPGAALVDIMPGRT